MSARDWVHGTCCTSTTLPQANPDPSNSFLQILPLPSRSNPHSLLHDRPLQPRRPKLAPRHRNHQSSPRPPLLWHQPIRSTVFRSHQPAARRSIRPNDGLHTRKPICKPAAATSPTTRPAGLHAVPGTALQRSWLWGELLPDGAADA